MKKVVAILLASVILAVWLFVITRIDGYFSIEGLFMSIFMSAGTFVVLVAICEVIRRIRNNEPLVEPQPRKPRKLPLWYRLLSKILP